MTPRDRRSLARPPRRTAHNSPRSPYVLARKRNEAVLRDRLFFLVALSCLVWVLCSVWQLGT